MVKALSESIGCYLDPSNPSGPTSDALETVFKIMVPTLLGVCMIPPTFWFREDIAFAICAAAYISTAIFLLSRRVNSVFLKWPDHLIYCTTRWRESLCGKSSIKLGVHASVGLQDKRVADALSGRGLKAFSSFDEYKIFIEANYGKDYEMKSKVSHVMINRTKLIVLSHHLRQQLKELPVALLSGVTKSGKSTLKEMLRNNTQSEPVTGFGPNQEHRTIIPQLVVCDLKDGKSFCLLDTIGHGTNIDESVAKNLDAANDVFRSFASATIIVCAQDDREVNVLASSTSKLRSNKVAGIPPKHPTLTCFNKADGIYGPKGFPTAVKIKRNPELGDYNTKFIKEAAERCKTGLPFDLRTIKEDSYSPRVFSCFDPEVIEDIPSKEPLPAEEKLSLSLGNESILITPVDVKNWLLSVFYNQDN